MRRWIIAALAAAILARIAWAVVAWWAWRDLDRPAFWSGAGSGVPRRTVL